MSEEYDIKTVMDRTGCDRETAVKTLEWSWNRTGVAMMLVLNTMNYHGLSCDSCAQPAAAAWNYCPYCGERKRDHNAE